MQFEMVFMQPQPGVDRSGEHWDEGLVNFGLEVSQARAPIKLLAQSLDGAILEAQRRWEEIPAERYTDPAGYWIHDESRNIVHDFERDEAKTPRSPQDARRAEEFQRRFIAEGFALVFRTPVVSEDGEEPSPGEDFVPAADMPVDPNLRSAIARHPIAREHAAVLSLIELLAGPDEDTVGEMQRRWCGAAGLLAHIAQGGYRIDIADGADA